MDPSLNYVLHPRRQRSFFSRSRVFSDSLHHRHSASATGTSEERDYLGDENRNSFEDVDRNQDDSLEETHRRLHYHSAGSVIPDPSYESVGRKRHLMESRGALNIPPVSTVLCLVFIMLYFYREKLHVKREIDVCVNWRYVWEMKQYWRLVVAQFFHFNRLQVIGNCFTLFAVGRYLERKVTKVAMIIIVIVMSAIMHSIYICINQLVCKPPQTLTTVGFGNVIYSLRVLLAYALEPMNYERDLVFGLYPMVVSASHAPWQPILDLIIYRIVLPEQCFAGQISGILAGFIVTFALLLWPTKGVYIASPPYYWTMMGSNNPPRENREDEDEDEDQWRIQTYTNSEFWLPTSSQGLSSLSPTHSTTSTEIISNQSIDTIQGQNQNVRLRHEINGLEKRSDELKSRLAEFFARPSTESVLRLMMNLNLGNGKARSSKRRISKRTFTSDDVLGEHYKSTTQEMLELHRRSKLSSKSSMTSGTTAKTRGSSTTYSDSVPDQYENPKTSELKMKRKRLIREPCKTWIICSKGDMQHHLTALVQ